MKQKPQHAGCEQPILIIMTPGVEHVMTWYRKDIFRAIYSKSVNAVNTEIMLRSHYPYLVKVAVDHEQYTWI